MHDMIEPLEPRRLLSTMVISGTVARPADFFGSSKRDQIRVEPGSQADDVWIHVNGKLTSTTAQTITIYAGRGDDTIQINLGEDPRYAGKIFVIHGGGGNDWITGAISAERIIAGDGNDTVSGSGGRDTIYGEGGDDSLRGGGSSDLLDGGDGRDTLRGDAGNDNISGGGDTDRLRGSLGDDTLRGGASKDFIGGEDGKDWLEGDGGADVLAGGNGNDYVNGGPGDDYCEGNAGKDVLAGWSGVDQLFGGPDGDAIQSPSEWTETRDFGAGDWNPIDNGPGGDGVVIHVSGSGAVGRFNSSDSGSTSTVKLDETPRPPGGVLDVLLLP
jgi:Ca2+-binding RTX toxin-like protein